MINNNYGYAANAYTHNEFNFNFKTSDGDSIKINLSKDENIRQGKDERGSFISFESIESLQFEYNGNGISEQDKREIANALKSIRPKVEAFFKNSLNKKDFKLEDMLSKNLDKKEVAKENTKEVAKEPSKNVEQTKSSLVDNLRKLMPHKKNDNQGNFAKSELVGLFSSILSSFSNDIEKAQLSEEEMKRLQKQQLESEKLSKENEKNKLSEKQVENVNKEVQNKKQIAKNSLFENMKSALESLIYDYETIPSNFPKYI
jgi:hypothetical protein